MEPTSSLYRQAAIEYQSAEKLGPILLLPRRLHVMASIVLAVLFVGGIVLLLNGQYAKKVSVTGWIVNPNKIINIGLYEASGIISEVLVSNNQTVEKGQALVKIKRTNALISGDVVTTKQHDVLSKQIYRANEQYDIANKKDKTDLGFIAKEHTKLESQQSLNDTSIAILSARIRQFDIQKRNLMLLALDKLVSQQELDNIQLSYSNAQLSLTQTQLNQLDVQQAIEHIEQKQNHIVYEASQRQAAHDKYINELTLQQALLQTQSEYYIVAPSDGIVDSLQAQQGVDLKSTTSLMKLIPNTAQLQAEIFIPANAIGLLQTEQSIMMRMDAFPYQQYGKVSAQLSHIDHSIMLPQHLSASAVSITQPVFMAKAVLPQQTIDIDGHAIHFKQGMTFSADVIVQQQDIVQWLLAPIYRLKGAL